VKTLLWILGVFLAPFIIYAATKLVSQAWHRAKFDVMRKSYPIQEDDNGKSKER